MLTPRSFRVAAFLALLAVVPSVARAQESKSAALATELAKLLEDMKLDSIAAEQSDQYIGALYIPGTQLLVVKAKYPATDRMKYLLTTKAYRDAYIDLNGTPERQSKLFVSDLGANGLLFRREKNSPSSDSIDLGGKMMEFTGDWGKAKISEAEYTKTYQTSDEEYSQMLQTLIAALKKPS